MERYYTLPKDDVNDDNARIIELYHNNGDHIKKGDQLYSFETSKANIDGVVCSPGDINIIREVSKKLLFVTPGIRLDTKKNDHNHVYTPRDAINKGSNYIVIGRPITEASDPMKIVTNIIEKINPIT